MPSGDSVSFAFLEEKGLLENTENDISEYP